MPVVPFTKPGKAAPALPPGQPIPSPTALAMAAALTHESGRLFEPHAKLSDMVRRGDKGGPLNEEESPGESTLAPMDEAMPVSPQGELEPDSK